MVTVDEAWRSKGATLSDKTVRKEFGRREVENFMNNTYNDRQHKQGRAQVELTRVNKELKQLRAQLAALEEQRAKLVAQLDD